MIHAQKCREAVEAVFTPEVAAAAAERIKLLATGPTGPRNAGVILSACREIIDRATGVTIPAVMVEKMNELELRQQAMELEARKAKAGNNGEGINGNGRQT